jgi:hypothetical protein
MQGEGESILGGIAKEIDGTASPAAEGAKPDAVAQPVTTRAPTRATMELVWPMMENTLVKVGRGEHMRLDPEEKEAWFTTMEIAYPDFDPDWLAKPLFWIITAAIFIPRITQSVMVILRDSGNERSRGEPSPDSPNGQSDDFGETGEREIDAC